MIEFIAVGFIIGAVMIVYFDKIKGQEFDN